MLIQFAYFGISSIAWFAMLWHPMKKFLYQKDNNQTKDSFEECFICSYLQAKHHEYFNVNEKWIFDQCKNEEF